MKIDNDKYYTPTELANECISHTITAIGKNNITEIIEPSVGNGSFLHHPKIKIDIAYDILPECESSKTIIKKCDFLSEPIEYKKGRLIIGNPPYGSRLYLAQRFYKKAVLISDYIAFILPISQLNNKIFLYEFDLISSQDLGEVNFSGKKLHCCFNIYSRPKNKALNKQMRSDLNLIKIYRQDCKDYDKKDYDIRMCYWGDGTVGKILSPEEHYSAEYKIKILENKYKDKIYAILTTFNWKEYIKGIAMKRLKQYDIIKVLLNEIPEIRRIRNQKVLVKIKNID